MAVFAGVFPFSGLVEFLSRGALVARRRSFGRWRATRSRRSSDSRSGTRSAGRARWATATNRTSRSRAGTGGSAGAARALSKAGTASPLRAARRPLALALLGSVRLADTALTNRRRRFRSTFYTKAISGLRRFNRSRGFPGGGSLLGRRTGRTRLGALRTARRRFRTLGRALRFGGGGRLRGSAGRFRSSLGGCLRPFRLGPGGTRRGFGRFGLALAFYYDTHLLLLGPLFRFRGSWSLFFLSVFNQCRLRFRLFRFLFCHNVSLFIPRSAAARKGGYSSSSSMISTNSSMMF